MRGLVPGIHVFAVSQPRKTWMAGHRRAEATPSFGRLCPAMTENGSTAEKPSRVPRVEAFLLPCPCRETGGFARLAVGQCLSIEPTGITPRNHIMSASNATQLPPTFNRLAWSNLAAQSAEQIALAAAPIVAVLLLGVGEGQTGLLQTALTL